MGEERTKTVKGEGMRTYKFETDEGLTLAVELTDEYHEDGTEYQTWSIAVQALIGFRVIDNNAYVFPGNVLNVEVLTSISKEEAE